MDESRWERWSALGGIAFVVLVAATAILSGSPPDVNDSPAEIARYVADHDTELRWSAYLGGAAVVFAFWWLGAVWRLLRGAEGGVPRLAVLSVAGLVFSATMAGVSGLVSSWLAVRAASLGASGLHLFYALATITSAATMFGIVAFVSGFSAVIIRTGVLPRPLGWFGAVVALVALVGGGAVASTRDVFFVISFVAFIGFLLWVLVASVLMLRVGSERPVPASTA